MSITNDLRECEAKANNDPGPNRTKRLNKIEAVCSRISDLLGSGDKFDLRFDELLQLAFSPQGAGFSRYVGQISPINQYITEALTIVTGDNEAAKFVLTFADNWLPSVVDVKPITAWGLIDLVELSLWSIVESEFSLRRMAKLLLIAYIKTSHTRIFAPHALALVLSLINPRLRRISVVPATVPREVQLLLLSMEDESIPVPPEAPEKEVDSLYWTDNDYMRLGVNKAYGLRLPTLLRLIDRPHLMEISIPARKGGSVLSRIHVTELAALLLLSRAEVFEPFDLGLCSMKLHRLLSAATTEYSQVDGPALILRNQLEIIVESTVWLLALLGLPPPSCENDSMRKLTRVGCESAVDIICAGTKSFKPRICVGACMMLRSYARSVHTLRTDQLVSTEKTDQLCASLRRLIVEEPEHGVDEAVAGLLCNLLIDFSRLRDPLIKLGIVPVLGDALMRNSSHSMTVSVLWALRNACAVRDALDVERLAFQTLDRLGLLKPLLENKNLEVARLFCALLGNVSPANLTEVHGLLGGRGPVVEYLTKQLECWEWASLQESAAQALANAITAVDVGDAEPDPFGRKLCQALVRCLQNPDASETFLANIGYIVVNALLEPELQTTPPLLLAERETGPMKRLLENRARMMSEEGVYQALSRVDSPALSVRNSLAAAWNAIREATK